MLKDKINLLRFKAIAHKRSVTPKGDCYINYIINKYVNNTKPDDYIESYEEMITNNESRVRSIHAFNNFYENEEEEEQQKRIHFLAANLALSLILISLHEEEVEKYLSLITNDEARLVINMLCHPNKSIKKLKREKQNEQV